MEERPILFNTEMVQAILSGRKTQTRRLVKQQPFMPDCVPMWAFPHGKKGQSWLWPNARKEVLAMCPMGKIGDQLYVRETYKVGAWTEDGDIALDYKASPDLTKTPWVAIEDDYNGEKYEALSIKLTDYLDANHADTWNEKSERYEWEPGKSPFKWTPSIHMPRWASRIQLEITDVRVERLQDISEDDAKAEGVQVIPQVGAMRAFGFKDYTHGGAGFFEAKKSFLSLWHSIYGNANKNPWVWVVEFKVVKS